MLKDVKWGENLNSSRQEQNTNNGQLGMESHQLLESEGGGLLSGLPFSPPGSGSAGSAKHPLQAAYQPTPTYSPQSGI